MSVVGLCANVYANNFLSSESCFVHTLIPKRVLTKKVISKIHYSETTGCICFPTEPCLLFTILISSFFVSFSFVWMFSSSIIIMIPQPLQYHDNRCNFYLLSKRCNSELNYHIKNSIKTLYISCVLVYNYY